MRTRHARNMPSAAAVRTHCRVDVASWDRTTSSQKSRCPRGHLELSVLE